MNSTKGNSLVFTGHSSNVLAGGQRSLRNAGFYQGIAQGLVKGFHTQQSIQDFISGIAWAADQAYAFRQYDRIGALSQLLLSLRLSPHVESIGHFYEALSVNRLGHGDTVRASTLFAQVADQGPAQYKARAMLALGARSISIGDNGDALPWYGEIVRMAALDRAIDTGTLYFARQMTAIVKGMDGDHEGAIRDLEEIFPLVRLASYQQPRAYAIHLNSLAVELAEVGRLEEAERASRIACSSLVAPAYPEWQETFDEIALKRRRASRSTITISGLISHPVEDRHRRPGMPTTQGHLVKPSERISLHPRQAGGNAEMGYDRANNSQARVLDFQQWKQRPKPDAAQLSPLSRAQRIEMSTGEKLIRLMDLISHDDTDDETIDVILEAVEAIIRGRRSAN